MKITKLFLFVLLGSLALQFFLPWYLCVLIAMLGGFFLNTEKGWQNALAGFLGVFVLWFGASVLFDFQSGGLISERMGAIFQLGAPGLTLPLLAAVIGGIAGALGALTGGSLKNYFQKA